MTEASLQRLREKIARSDEALVRVLAALPRELSDPAWRAAAEGCKAARSRVGLGRQVAEAKWRLDAPRLQSILAAGDRDSIAQAITDSEVEERVLERVHVQARLLGGEALADRVGRFYRNWVIPETKRLQIEHLLAKKGIESHTRREKTKEI